MAYNDAILKKSSSKFFLAAFSFSRDVGEYDSGSLGGSFNSYTAVFDEKPDGFRVQGEALTEVDGTIDAADQWYYNEGQGLIYFSSQLDLINTVEEYVLLAEYRVFITDAERAIQAPDFLFGTGETFFYRPRITNDISVTESIANLYRGRLTFNSISLSFEDTDKRFQTLLLNGGSINGAQLKIVHCIDRYENRKTIYRGIISGVKLGRTITLSIDFDFGNLKNSATFGDTPKDYILDTENFPNLHPIKENAVVPFTWGQTSKFKVTNVNYDLPSNGLFLTGLDPESLLEAHCIKYDEAIPATNGNNEFICGRSVALSSAVPFNPDTSGGNQGTTFAYPNAGGTSNPNFYYIDYNFNATQWNFVSDAFEIGQTLNINGNNVRIHQMSDDFRRLRVITAPDVSISDINSSDMLNVNNLTVSVFNEPSVVVKTDEGLVYQPWRDYDYTFTQIPTDGGNILWRLNMQPNRIQAFSSIATRPFNPDLDQVFYRIPRSEETHPIDFASLITKEAGLTVDEAQFQTVKSSYDLQSNFLVGETETVESYGELLERLLSSTGDIIRLGDEGLLEYVRISEAPYTPIETIDDTVIPFGELKSDVSYDLIASRMVFINPNRPTYRGYESDGFENPIRESRKADYFYGSKVERRPQSVLIKPGAVADKLFNRFSQPIVTFQVKTSYSKSNLKVGDIVTLKSTDYFGSSDVEKLCLITSITRNRNDIIFKATQLPE